MKSKFFTLFAAFVLLFSAQASAQVNGDVNEDGVVNEQDIAAIIQIMQEAGGVKEQTKYYWYAGWTEPTAANIATLVNKQLPTNTAMTTFTNAGKTSTTTSGITFDLLTQKYYDDEYINAAQGNKVKRNYYIVVPNGQGIYDSLGTKLHLDNAFATVVGTFTNHTIYKSTSTSVSIGSFIIK